MFDSIGFLYPYLLWALVLLPALWWLLRVLPPKPRTVRFPAFALLKGLTAGATTTARTPWWLILLRCLIVVSFILACAGPVLHPADKLPGGTGDVALVIDNGWAAAANWPARLDKAKEVLTRARREGRAVFVLATADGKLQGPADEETLARLRPVPWPVDRTVAAAALAAARDVTYAVFLSDGVDGAGAAQLAARVSAVVGDDAVNDPVILRSDHTLERLRGGAAAKVALVALTRDGAVMDEAAATFAAGETRASFTWNLPPEARRRTARIAVRGREEAAAVLLADASWRRHAAGIVADAERKDDRDFLSDIYYLRRALEAEGEVKLDAAQNLVDGSVSVIVLPDGAPASPELVAWVERGGFLIRFAGPVLAAKTDDDLLPVPLRVGGRALSGAMTWEQPLHLGEVAAQSPLRGLAVPKDVTVTRQVLAEPSPDTFEKTWLSLEDGTPLITAARRGKGTVVLVHTTAGPDWSDFCYSGLFVEALQRLARASDGIAAKDEAAGAALHPLFVLDGFGRLGAPDGAESVKAEEGFSPSPRTPPGLYGGADDFRAFNLGDALPQMKPLVADGAQPYAGDTERSLMPGLLRIALLLLLADTLVALKFRGAAVFLLMLLSVAPAQAQEEEGGLRFAYVETGDEDLDRVSYEGLEVLRAAVNARTTVEVKGVDAVDPARDALAGYPFLYWPMAERAAGLSMSAVNNVQDYMTRGGLILFDTRDGQFGKDADSLGARKLREVTQDLRIPELAELPKDHILARSFYLLDDYAGRYAGGRVWAEKEPGPRHDGVPVVIIGGNDWARGWSEGGPQREMALRFGVNLVMIALTGSYKADQIHVPYILERVGK